MYQTETVQEMQVFAFGQWIYVIFCSIEDAPTAFGLAHERESRRCEPHMAGVPWRWSARTGTARPSHQIQSGSLGTMVWIAELTAKPMVWILVFICLYPTLSLLSVLSKMGTR